MVWDGECGFCRYWTIRWQKITGTKVKYVPYQEVYKDFPDIDQKHFRQASRLIEPDGKVFSGPRSAYRTFTYGRKWAFLDRWYETKSWFQKLSDWLYNRVAQNRSMLFKLTKALFGSDPHNTKPFWVIYLALVVYFIYISLVGLPV